MRQINYMRDLPGDGPRKEHQIACGLENYSVFRLRPIAGIDCRCHRRAGVIGRGLRDRKRRRIVRGIMDQCTGRRLDGNRLRGGLFGLVNPQWTKNRRQTYGEKRGVIATDRPTA